MSIVWGARKTVARFPVLFLLMGQISFLFANILFAEEPSSKTYTIYQLSAGRDDKSVWQAGVYLEALTHLSSIDGPQSSVNLIPAENDQQTLLSLLQERMEFGILKGSTLFQDADSLALIKRELRIVALLWREALHFLIRSAYVQSGTVSDLRALPAERILSGSTGTSMYFLKSQILEPLKLQDKITVVPLQHPSENINERDGIIWLSGLPSGFIHKLEGLGSDWMFLNLPPSDSGKMKNPAWSIKTVLQQVYNGRGGEIEMLTNGVYLVTLSTLDREGVYNLMHTLYKDCHNLVEKSPIALGDVQSQQLPEWQDNLIAFHEGALLFYQDVLERGDTKASCD